MGDSCQLLSPFVIMRHRRMTKRHVAGNLDRVAPIKYEICPCFQGIADKFSSQSAPFVVLFPMATRTIHD